MGLEYFDQPLVLCAIFLDASQLVAGRTECATGRMTQRSDRGGGFPTGVNHVFSQCADYAVAAGIYICDPVFVLACGFNDSGGGCVNDGRDAARLCIERVHSGHVRDHLRVGLNRCEA